MATSEGQLTRCWVEIACSLAANFLTLRANLLCGVPVLERGENKPSVEPKKSS
jgi:hypothetical protein